MFKIQGLNELPTLIKVALTPSKGSISEGENDIIVNDLKGLAKHVGVKFYLLIYYNFVVSF